MPDHIELPETQTPKRPSSARRIAANRENGKRSKGPKTPEGKAKCARTGLRHGILCKSTVLEHENPEQFQHLLSQYLNRFSPVDDIEMGHIEDITNAYWRIRRLRAMETRAMDNAARGQSDGDELDRILAAFTHLANDGSIDLIIRYETRLHRMQHRALQDLLTLKDRRQNASAAGIASAAEPELGTQK